MLNPSWRRGARGGEVAGRVIEPRNWYSCGPQEIPPRWRGTPTASRRRKAAVLGARGRVPRTPPGSESGAWHQRGHSGTWESHDAPWGMAGTGSRGRKPPSPAGWRGPVTWLGVQKRITPGSRRTRDNRRTPRQRRGSRRGAEYRGSAGQTCRPGRWGTEAQGTHCRAGDAGQNGLLGGTRGDTSRPPTISTTLPRRAQQAIQSPALVCTTLAHLMDVDLLREACHRTRQDAAPGIDGVTAAT